MTLNLREGPRSLRFDHSTLSLTSSLFTAEVLSLSEEVVAQAFRLNVLFTSAPTVVITLLIR